MPIILLIAATLIVGFFPNTVLRRSAPDFFAVHRREQSMIPAPCLEIAVLVWGLILLLAESFAGEGDKRSLALAGIAGLFVVLVASFFLAPPPAAALTGFWSFYTADPLAIFFKRFALVTTIIVLIMAIDYAPAIRLGVPGANPQAGLGEFFTLPIFTCAGLMWMASAIDFVMIFVSLELVTMSFYVLVTFTRRNPVSLEAGVKYLILSALSTGFLVYGITWIFGVTGETNLARIGMALATQDIDRIPTPLRHRARPRGAWFQDRGGAVSDLGAGCLSRRAHAGNGVSFGRFQGGGIRRAPARACAVSGFPRSDVSSSALRR